MRAGGRDGGGERGRQRRADRSLCGSVRSPLDRLRRIGTTGDPGPHPLRARRPAGNPSQRRCAHCSPCATGGESAPYPRAMSERALPGSAESARMPSTTRALRAAGGPDTAASLPGPSLQPGGPAIRRPGRAGTGRCVRVCVVGLLGLARIDVPDRPGLAAAPRLPPSRPPSIAASSSPGLPARPPPPLPPGPVRPG